MMKIVSYELMKIKRLYIYPKAMFKPVEMLVLLLLVSGCLAITGIGMNPIRPLQLNKGQSTKYMFYINPEQEILTKAKISITFPSEFDKTAIASSLSCMASSLSYTWKSVPCLYSNGSVIISLGAIKNEQINILISQPTNPSTYSMSSYFSVCLMVDTMITTCDKTFGKVVFPNVPLSGAATSTYPSVTSLNSIVVGQSSTYQIQFSASQTYGVGNTIRITFPPGFQTSSSPMCQMNGTYNQVITTFVWPDKRSIECQNINKTIFQNESLKIIGIFNPNYAGTFGNIADGFKLEILQETTTIILEQVLIQKTVDINAGLLTGLISQANNFIVGDVVYTFYINLLNALTSDNFILIKFDRPWILYNNLCTAISGITMAPKTTLRCTNYTTTLNTFLNVSGFVSASVANQLVFSITVRSPNTAGTYNVGIQTANLNGVLDTMTTNVFLNSSYGDYSMLSINAIVAQSNVPVSGTGPLELTFFLNYELPQTNVLTYGKFVVKIFPQIPLPPPLVNGVLKCYFFNTIPAQTCTWDTTTSASYTLVTINTPLTLNFQYSEIPITITTQGAVNSSKIGITIADLVTRYRFEMQAYKQTNSTTPTQVYFSEYIAAPIPLTLTTYALTHEVNEYTHLRFQYTIPYNFTTPYVDDLRIKIQFLSGGGWADNLGYQANRIYKRFPCVFSDNRIQTIPPQYNSQVACDLYTYKTGPHASLTNQTYRGPYILVYGFTNQMLVGGQVRLQVGRFLIGSSTNVASNIRFSLIQETPTMLTKYVELYYTEFNAFTTTTQGVAVAGTSGVTIAMGNSLINAVSNHTITYTAPATFFAIIYQYDQISTQSFPNVFVECTRLTSTNKNWCTMLGYPVNYIVEYTYLTSFATAVSSIINMTNGVYSGTFSATVRAFSSAGSTILKKTFNVVYSPFTISSADFWLDTGSIATLYKGAETYFFVNFTAITSTPAGGFVRFIFGTGAQLGLNPFCTSSSFDYIVPELGLICTRQSSTTLKISNIGALAAGTYYLTKVRISTLLTTGSTVRPTVTIQTHYSTAADPSIVDQINSMLLNANQNNYYSIPNDFRINNPRIAYETPRTGYIGKWETYFNPSSDVLSAYQIKLILSNHAWNGGIWTTPNSVTSDPLVCYIENIRVPCTYTLSPLTVVMNVAPAGITYNKNNLISLDTEYLVPYNGIKHPSEGGQYNCKIQFLDNSSSIIQQQSFYNKVSPRKLRNFYVNSSVNDVGVENMFYVQFQLDSVMLNSYTDSTRYSRIYVEFPTVDSVGNALFANNLGGYSKTGQYVGCAFDTWNTYYVGSITDRLRCRLIMSQVPGDPVRVQIINHDAFNSNWRFMRLWIAKVFNPTNPVTSVPISIRMDHVVVATNDVYELYYDTFDVFMNSQTPNPSGNYASDCQASCSCTIFSGNVYNVQYFRFYPYAIGSVSSTFGFYYVLDTTSMFTPMSLQTYRGSNYCYSYNWECLTFPDINYIVIYTPNNNYQTRIYIQAGNAYSQAQTGLVAKIWNQQRYMGTHTINISPTCWFQLHGTFGSVTVTTTTGSGRELYLNKRKVEAYVSFTTQYIIPQGGSLQIFFPSSVPRIYPHCRSMNNLGSSLTAIGATENGEIGCLVQATRSWVITGFSQLAAGSTVIIVGLIDLPSSYYYLGYGEIISYNSTHPTDIRSNGFIIDFYSNGNFGIYVNNAQGHNTDSEITLEETLPLRINYVGALKFKFQLASDLIGPNQGVITVRLPGVSTLGQSGGFIYASTKKHVCQIVEISTFEQTGCIITDISIDSSTSTFPNYILTMIVSSTLLSSKLYRLVISTHTGVQPEGIAFPTVAGTYKIDFNFDTTNSTSNAIHNQLYLQVYGTKFSYLQVIAMVTCPSHRNLIWVKVSPTTTIQTTQQLIIEVPTRGADGRTLFSNDLGTGLADGADIPHDILTTPFTNGFMICRLLYGDQSRDRPGRIVCGNFQSTISSGQTLFFAFTLGNPTLSGSQVSIPFFIYSSEQGKTYKTNFDVIENAVHLRSDVYYSGSDVAGMYSQNQQLQTTGMYLDMITRNVWNLDAGEYYIIYFNFPLRNNGKITSGCSYPGSSVYGDAYYHMNIWAIVCAVTTGTSIGVPGGGYTTRNLRIAGFYTPFYYLSAAERVIKTYSNKFTWKITSVGQISDGYPNQNPKTVSNPTFSLTPLHQTGTQYAGSRDDYTISFTYTNSATDDLSFTQLIAVIFPTGIDYSFPESDCVQAVGSQIEVATCWIDTSIGVVWIKPVVKSSYTSNMIISVMTRGLAVRNPVTYRTTNANQFVIKYYSWQNITQPALDPINNNYYCFLSTSNFPSSSITYSLHPSPYALTTFTYLKYPHIRYYTDTPFSSLVHRAPFEMEFTPTVTFNTITGSNFHIIKVVYPSGFSDAAMIKIRDLQVFRPVCYLNNQRIRLCSIDTSAHSLSMSFQFSLSTSSRYHLKFSILDSRNSQIDGFLPSTAVNNVVLMYQPSGGSWYYTETDQFPTLYSLPTGANAGPFRGIIAGSATYGHSAPSQLNFVNLLLTFNRTDITGLVFEIASVDKNGNRLFGNAAAQITTFMSQENGGSYPCGNNGYNAGGSVKCYLLSGDWANNGLPTRIIMTEFTYVTQMNCRLVFVNPAATGVYFSVVVRAFGGAASASNPYGNQYMGFWEFNQIFEILSGCTVDPNTYTANYYQCPSLSPWRDNTDYYVFSKNWNIGGGRSSIASVLLYDSSAGTTDDYICEAVLGSSNFYDDKVEYTLTVSGVTKKWAYFITTYQGTSNVANTTTYGWTLSYLKCKYFAGFSITAYFFFTDISIEVATNTYSLSYCNSQTSGVTSPTSKYFSQNYFISDGTPITYVHQIDFTATINSISNFAFRNADSMVLMISYSNNFWGTMSSCALLGGLNSTSINQRITCTVSSNRVVLSQISGFLSDPLLASSTNLRVKFSFIATGLSNINNVGITFYTILYANIDAFNNNYQGIFYKSASLTSSCYYSSPGTCTLGQNGGLGTFVLQKATDTYLQVAFSPDVNLGFVTNTPWQHYFEITFNSFDFGPSCTISNVVFEMSSSSTPGSGFNNTFPVDGTTCSSSYIRIFFQDRMWKDYWGGSGASADGNFSPGEYIIFYITISPDPASRDLPTLHHEYLFLHGAFNYRWGGGGWTSQVQRTVTFASQALAASATLSTLTTNRGGVTELSFTLSALKSALGPMNNGYWLMAEFIGSSGWTSGNDPFASYTNSAIINDYLACKCVAGSSPLSISTSSPFVDSTCIRRQPSGSFTNYAILVNANAQMAQDLTCFFPQFAIASGMSFSAQFKLVYHDNYPPELSTISTKYSSLFRTTSNTLTFSGSSPTMSLTGFSSLVQTPNFYASTNVTVGSTLSGAYTLSGSWGSGLSSPYVYMNFNSAGPIPVYSFCSDSNTFLQCRVYSQFVNILVAQLKSSSSSSFSLSKGSSTLLYPLSQFSISSTYGANIYIGVGNWQYSTSISRSINYLTPISTNIFQVYSDKYGSSRSSYDTNIFFAFSTSGQTLFNYAGTNSQFVISWVSTLTVKSNCQVWVDNDPNIFLECIAVPASKTITIISRYKDYTPNSNIFVSIGLYNPTTASTTFYLKLYSYYYTSSRYSLTISTSATYTADTSFTSYTQVAKSIVRMYPFESKIATVANAPLRMRFSIPSSSISYGVGSFVFTNSQIQYTSSHLCYFISYASYSTMMQQTERTVYRASSCSSSGSTITVYPPKTLTISPGNYYQLVLMPLGINAAGCAALFCATQSGYQQTNFDLAYLIAYSDYTGTPNIVSQQVNRLYAYQGSKNIGLQHIYALGIQPGLTSLYFAININFTSSYNFPQHYLEITLFDLTISAFISFAIGDIIPCQLSSAFLPISAREFPQCRVVSADKINSFVRIRIENIGFLSPQTYWITLDDISLPVPSQSDKNNKFDISVSYHGPSNVKYENFFPEIFQIDNTNYSAPVTVTSTTYTFNNPALTGYGVPITGQITFNWPFDSSSTSYESKLSLNFNGGYSAVWTSTSALSFADAMGTYLLLWVNTKLNKFVFLLPNKGNGASTTLNISALNNPYPYQRELYNTNSTNVIINFYNNFYLQNKQTFNQPAFTVFTKNLAMMFINQNFPCNTIDNYPSTNTYAAGALQMLTLSVQFDQTPANILTRNLGNIMVTFTSGVNYIRECRVLRNNTLHVNTLSACQPYYDGTYWNVKLYDVAKSDLSTGWWIQIWVTFNSGTLAYTSYVMATNNLVVQYQSSYSLSLAAYNGSRSIPTTLSWLNKKYIAHFYETQYKFIEAVTGQKTQYIKFRFTMPFTNSGSNDLLRIYLPSNAAQQPFTPVTSGTNLICQFLPALSGDKDFTIGMFAQASLLNTGSQYYFEVYFNNGGLTGGADYLLQISQYNTATSSFYMAIAPGRQKIEWVFIYYPSNYGYEYWDSFYVKSYRFFRQAELLHTTTTVNDYQTITFNYKPYGALSAGSSNNEISLRLSIEARYHSSEGGITAIYTADNKNLVSGSQFSGVVSNPNNAQVTTIQFAQYSIDKAPLRIVLTKQSAYADNTQYYWIVPLLQNPGTAYITLRYNLTLVCSPASGYEYIHNHYESLNEYYTLSDTSASMTTSITNSLRAVQTVSAVDLSVNLGSYSLGQWNTAIFKINNALSGLIQNIATPNDTSNYNYYYFKVINMIMAQKKNTNTITTIGIGAASSSLNYQSTFGLSWVRIFANSNAAQATNPTTLYYSNPPTLTLTYLTNYAASSLTLIEGLQTKGSTAMFKATFTTPIIPELGQIRLLFDNTKFSSLNNGSCRVNLNLVRSSTRTSIMRCYRTSQGFRIAGFSALTAGTSISTYIMLKSLASGTSNIQADVFGIYQDNTTRISLANIGSLTTSSGTVPNYLYRFEETVVPYFSTLHYNRYYLLEGSFNLRLGTLQNGDYIFLTQPAGWPIYGDRRLLIKQNSTLVTGWTQLKGYTVSSTYYRFTIPNNFLVSQAATMNIQYLFKYTSNYASSDGWSYYNGLVTGGSGNSRFQIQTYRSGAYTEHGYYDFVPYPSPFTMTINNRYPAAGRQTVLDLTFIIDVDAASEDKLVFSFDTSNLLYQMFANDLEGQGTNGATYRYLDCRQLANNYISASRLVCILYFGNNLANPPIPANLTIKFTQSFAGWTTSRQVQLIIGNVMNPNTENMNVGVKVSLNNFCETQQNQPCTSYEARGFYVTQSTNQNYQNTTTSFSSSSSLVLTTGLTHTFTLILTASIGTLDAIYIIYPENFQGLMPSDCSVSSYNCYVFPTRRWVVLFPTTTITSGSKTISITSMNNPYYAQPYSLYFLVTVARNNALGDTYKILQGAFTPVSYSFQNTGVSTSMSVVTTQTPSMYLRNYANTIIFTINNIFSDSRAKAIYVLAPADVLSWDPTYCNATITSTLNFNYPLRFTCIVDPSTPQFLRLTLDSDMPSYDTSWGTMSIRLHAKFTLADFPTAPTLYQTLPVTSGNFYAYSSVNATSSSSLYYMTQTSVTVSISQNQVPVISVINFNTQSFADRLARVNNKEVFYMLFKPLVNVVIGSIVFTIPSQFNYPGVFQFDNCLMIGRLINPQFNCQLSRSQGQTLVTLVPTNYDNQVKIIQIGTVSQSNWFTAPGLPGDFYNMNVAIYGTNGTLIAKQTRNISPVYGQSLDIPSITISNIQDANIKLSVYDLRFLTGSLQIPPGAPTTATTQTSQLQFIFENFNGMNPTNVFANDLKTGLFTGNEVGCKIFNGLTALPGMRIKCLLYVGTNQTNKPKIRVINYDFINPQTTIIISFSGIQSLPSVLVNTISIGAVIFYTDIGSSTFLYIPTPIITVPTNATTLFSGIDSSMRTRWAANSTYSGTNIVLQPTILSIGILSPGNYWNNQGYYIGYSTYTSTGANDQFVLLTFYPPTLLDKNNPIPVSCALCSSVDIYYASGMVRFRHTQTLNSNTYTNFVFSNFPTSAYSLLNQTVNVYFQIFSSYQAIYSSNLTVSLPRTVEKCTLFSFGVVSVSSLNGGEIGVTYLFSIQTNHFVPSNGALSITLPIQYGDMISNGATCQLVGFELTSCYCRIGTPSRIDIYANGTELATKIVYSVRITGLQNPNIDSSNFIFIVTSYYIDNIYLGLKICENQILPPSINIKPLRTCTLSWSPQYYNQNFNASYVFQLSCSDVFRGDSTLYISLPSAYSTNNPSGTLPCSSYESTTLVAPICTLQNLNGVLTLSTSIDASSQSSLSLLINLVNPINNTYFASASVTSKGTQYASSGNSSITILANSYKRAQKSDVDLINMPKEAGLMSTYIFKIAPMSTFAPSNLGITFPNNFYLDSSKLKVSIANTAVNNFFAQLSYNNIQALVNNVSSVGGVNVSSYPTFTATETALYLTNITGQVSSSKWTYVFVSGIQNPSSYIYANFTIAYYLISNGFQALEWAFQNPLTYYISSPPKYIAINTVNVSDYDILYPSNYTFAFSGSNGSNIALAGKNLSYILVIPTFYKNTLWANTPPICKFAELNVTSSCYSYQSQIIVTETFTTNRTSLTLTISTLLNPALPTTCKTTDTSLLSQTFFIIRIIDTLSNTFLFESSSVVDASNCLTFSSIRIPISLEYSLIMTAGLAYNITYGLTKPASNLKITAYVSNSGFSFSPTTVDFNDYYTLSKSTQLFLRSDIAAGTYVIYFNKSESSQITYFRNILPVTITVSAASNVSMLSNPTISIPSMSDSTVGYPVVIPLEFSLPSSTEMTLFMSISQESNMTLTQFSPYLSNFSITPRIINIQPQQTLYNFTLTQGKQVVPPPLTLQLKLTSNYPIVHTLTTPTVYLCFDRDPKFNVLYPPLRVTVTQFLSSCNLQDVGKTVTNIMISNQASQSSAGSVTPKIISIRVDSVASTGAVLTINSISSGNIYFSCQPAGYAPITNAKILANMSNAIGVSGVAESKSLTVSSSKTAQINYVATATIGNLSQSTNYIFYAISQNNLGTSEIKSLNFTTTVISKGVQMRLYFTTVVANLDLVNSLVQVLRVSPLRIKILTSIYSLQKQQAAASASRDNKPRYAYDIVIAPDPSNDIVAPLTIVENFVKSSASLQTFKGYLPTFDYSNNISYFELRPVYPIVISMPASKSINLYNATFVMQFWTQSNLYAVLFESIGSGSQSLAVSERVVTPKLVSSLNATERASAPSSTQIKAGTDNNNVQLGKYKIVKVISDEKGVAEIVFSDLKPQSNYIVFITASSPLPYEPTMLWSDDKVITYKFSTLPNPNVGNSTKQSEYVKELNKYNPELAGAMEKFIKLSQSKSDTKSSK